MVDPHAGLRALVGAGPSRVSLSAALRARDMGAPSEAELAAAEVEIDRRLAGRPPAEGRVAPASPQPSAGSARQMPTPSDVGGGRRAGRSAAGRRVAAGTQEEGSAAPGDQGSGGSSPAVS